MIMKELNIPLEAAQKLLDKYQNVRLAIANYISGK
jgi:hypothetical protein